jgi:RNA recognition motif-containing protein
VFIGNLNKHAALTDIETFVQKWGLVRKVQQHMDEKGRSKNFVFVEFETKEGAQNCVAD